MKAILLLSAIAVMTLQLGAQAPPQQVGGLAVQQVRRPPPPTTPTPRFPDGSIDLSGVWIGGGTDGDLEIAGGLKRGDIQLTPAAKDYLAKLDLTSDPSSYCLPMGIPRKGPYPWRFVQDPPHGKPERLYVLEEGNIHTFRQIFLDGRKHPTDPVPTWFGHSIGWWEGDTLVVDTVGFNGKVWMDRRGLPQTEQGRVIERFTRINMGTLQRVVTVEDPAMYAKPFTVRFTATLGVGDDLIENICQENNQYGGAGGFAMPPAAPSSGR